MSICGYLYVYTCHDQVECLLLYLNDCVCVCAHEAHRAVNALMEEPGSLKAACLAK